MMSSERWRRIEAIYHAAQSRPFRERSAYLAAACAGDDDLRREVESLLAQTSALSEHILGEPVAAVGSGSMPATGDPSASLIGERLGHYHIVGRLGVGGMGEVYRARDTKLGRDVAIKILPPAFTSDPERLARFEREARVLASLNHPHIGAIYGLEDTGGVRALVLELIDGQTLADRIRQGPLPLNETLTIAGQLVAALDAAHERGIVHRDFKPANIKITPEGVVKVLDFGIAKASGETASSEASRAPTVTVDRTHEGLIIGTAAYMSPEQARGGPVDKRTDIWAFGCVLYEMLTGRRAFDREDVSEALAAVLRDEPDWAALPATVPPAIRTLIERCLDKDRRGRVADISTARYVFATDPVGIAPGSIPSASAITPIRPVLWRRLTLPTAMLLAGGIMVGAAVWVVMRPATNRMSRLALPISATAAASGVVEGGLALAPDGARVIYVGNNGTQLLVRSLDALDPIVLATGKQLRILFVSPNGPSVGFEESSAAGTPPFTLKKVALTGGAAVTLIRLDNDYAWGATWTPDDRVIVGGRAGLRLISSAGEPPTVLTQPDQARNERSHSDPEVLPGGRVVLFTIETLIDGADALQIAVRDLTTGAQKILLRGGRNARYLTSGHLVYLADGTLRAVPFDLRRLEVRGTPVTVVPHLATTSVGSAAFAVGPDGTLAYLNVTAGAVPNARTLVWVDRAGQEQPIPSPPRAYVTPRVSRDGTRIAVSSQDQEEDIWNIWTWDLARTTLMRVTTGSERHFAPVWTPDDRHIVFDSRREGRRGLWRQAADGSGTPQRLTTSNNIQYANSISADGTDLIFSAGNPTTGFDLMRLSLDGTHRVSPLLQTQFREINAEVSPDGRWLAYESNYSGQQEIYVRPYPEADTGQWPVSTDGGIQPVWARNGKELFYLSPDGAVMSVRVEASADTWRAATPVKLFQGRYDRSTLMRTYDVSPDGQRFLMMKPEAPHLVVVWHFDEELKRLVPTN